MAGGRNIRLYLLDGEVKGAIKCTLANWTGVAYKIPRTDLNRYKDREDLKQSGVYFLLGNPEESEKPVVYVGQAGARKNGEGTLNRLLEHRRNSDKDYWTEAVIFTTADNSFGPTEISYLEHRFFAMASEINRYTVKNGNEPTVGNITEEKESELEEFIDNAKLVMAVLGHKVFEPYFETKHKEDSEREQVMEGEEELLHFHFKGIHATARRTEEGFVLLRGSGIVPEMTKSCPIHIHRSREKYAYAVDEHCSTKEDLLFHSPSGAASFVAGASVNGFTAWKTADGVTLKELEERE